MIRRTALAVVLSAVALCVVPAAQAANEPFGIKDFDVTFTDGDRKAVTQAGSHPDELTVSFGLTTKERIGGGVNVSERLKDLNVGQIAGFVGNPTAVPRCSDADFLTFKVNAEQAKTASCADSSAVGIVGIESVTTGVINQPIWTSVFNLQPPPGSPAKLGFWTGGVPVTIELGVSESPPYNIVGGPTNVSQLLEVTGSEFILWGVPADPAHDSLRGICVSGVGPEPKSSGECPAGVGEEPFLTLPRACEGPLATHYEADSWENPGDFSANGSVLTHDSAEPPNPLGMTGCSKLGFNPEVSISPTSSEAESSSGLDIEITVDDQGLRNSKGTANADIEATEFALPQGMTLNPSAAEGLGVCTLAQYEAATLTERGCPEASKIGSLEVDTPILENHTLKGSIYLAAQRDNPFGSFFAAYLMVRDPGLGVFTKLPAEVETNPATGQIVTAVRDIPAFPYSRIKVHLRSGPRAPLVTPPGCGPHTTAAVLTPSSGKAPLATDSTFQIDSGPGGGPCTAGGTLPFVPGFEAGTANNAAGSYSPFLMGLTRRDGDQDLTRFSATLPPGVTAKIAGLAECSDAQLAAARARSGREELAAPSCPDSSRLGGVLAGAGVGTALTYVPGSLYLAGPYNGAPLSVAAVVPAVAGPFDVGTIVTRVALNLNPDTARAEVDGSRSDPIPHILEGIPLKVRDIRVTTDRPGFTLNPTGCKETATTAQIFGSFADPFNPADDQPVSRTSRFQAASCASLLFQPKLALELKGATKRSQNPALKATYAARPGDANLGGALVTLPPSQFIDNAHINNPCTRAQFAANACPPSSVLGTARAITPLLDAPLEGPIYFRSNGGERLLPDVVADLKGQFRFTLVIAILKSRNARIRTKVLNAPDAPVTKFVLNMVGGKKGLLENSRNLCREKQRAKLDLAGQNGRHHRSRPVVKTSCKGKGAKGSRADRSKR